MSMLFPLEQSTTLRTGATLGFRVLVWWDDVLVGLARETSRPSTRSKDTRPTVQVYDAANPREEWNSLTERSQTFVDFNPVEQL